jgi:hypothetical protein
MTLQYMVDIRIRKVKALAASQRERLKKNTVTKFEDEDLVIVRTTAEKIIGSPLAYIQKGIRQWKRDSG